MPEVIEAVEGDIPVLIDGGIRRGTDVLKALSLGATATLIGRPILWGLALNGEAGVGRVLQIIHGELDRALALCGIPSIGRVTSDLIRRCAAV
jgi:4-hydroxymandelate oxidase